MHPPLESVASSSFVPIPLAQRRSRSRTAASSPTIGALRACHGCMKSARQAKRRSPQQQPRHSSLEKTTAASTLPPTSTSSGSSRRRRVANISSSSSSTMVFLAAAATFACCSSLASAAVTPHSVQALFPCPSSVAAFLPQALPLYTPRRRRRVLSSSSSPSSSFPFSAVAGRSPSSGGSGGLQMISSMFRWRGGKSEDGEEVLVNIESPSANVRRISSSIVINRPVQDVWRILTDYDNLAEYVPNLTQSRLVNTPAGWQPRSKNKEVRLFQEGAQTIIGFNFKASLTMDMEEVFEDVDEKLGQRRIKFRLVDSAMFSDFSGEWRLQYYSRMRTACENEEWTYSTKLFYMVNVKPKGPVPVGALEWRIKEDVPTNLRAVKVASEKLPWECEQDQAALAALAAGRRELQSRMTVARDWMSDETLGAYIGEAPAGGGGGASSMKEVLRVGVGSGGATGGGEGMREEGGGGRNVVSKIAVTGSPMSGRNETASTNMFGRLFLR
ncbi:oligoketide cyclase lipid transport protein [Nannochloropsis oceanica]